MGNPYEEGSIAWILHEDGERLGNTCAVGDELINATDRRSVALYKVGAAIVQEMSYLSDALSGVANAIEEQD